MGISEVMMVARTGNVKMEMVKKGAPWFQR
jgi:hypothetical protein